MHNPIDSDLKSLLEAPLDGPSEGDDLQGEEAGCQQAGLLLATTTALVSGRPGVSGPELRAGSSWELRRWPQRRQLHSHSETDEETSRL